MNKINIGEVSVEEFNLIMKQLSAGQLGECIELFMKLRAIAEAYTKSINEIQNQTTLPVSNPDVKP